MDKEHTLELHRTTIDESKRAQRLLSDSSSPILRSPLVRLNWGPSGPPDGLEKLEIYLKLENLQPIGSFKLRGAMTAIQHHLASSSASSSSSSPIDGFVTASAGNMAQGVAWSAAQIPIPCLAIVPDNAPQNKVDKIKQLGGKVIRIPYHEWWTLIETGDAAAFVPEGTTWKFIHPVMSQQVMAGNSTVALEIAEDLPGGVASVVLPYGGGGLSCGVASIVKTLMPDCSVFAVEPSTAAPLASSLASGARSEEGFKDYEASFIDGCGGKSVLASMWPLARTLLDGGLVVTPEETARAIKHLVQHNRIVAEGAGAVAVAAAMKGLAGKEGKVVCVVSGGGLDTDALIDILQDRTPGPKKAP